MKVFKTVKKTVKIKELIEWKCSVCGLDLLENSDESEEVFVINEVGGFSSVFGDGNLISIDICQHCFKKAFGKFCTVKEYEGNEEW